MKYKQKIKMSFVCDQDWNSMKPTACGRFCDMCQKEVYDFTGKSVASILKLKEENPEICGQFDIQQVDEDIICELKFPFAKNISAIAASLALFFTAGKLSAQEQTKPKTEQHENLSKENKTTNTTTATQKHVCSETCSCNKQQDSTCKKDKIKRRLYLSKRFPFIHVRRRLRTVGRF